MKRLLWLLFILAATLTSFFLFRSYYPAATSFLSSDLLSLTDNLINTPPPLRHNSTTTGSALTVAGLLRETNYHRANNDLSPVILNDALSQAAANKLNDMFVQQYFEHVGPDGRSPSDWVEEAGYSYLTTGENLALGNFASDAALVQAWMDSPGHRANILNPSYTELGLAAAPGLFENERTWLAVQEFGKPVGNCLPAGITSPYQLNQIITSLNNQQSDLARRQAELSSLSNQIKTLINQSQAKTNQGNQEISTGNQIYQDTGDREAAEAYWSRGETLQAEGRALLEQAENLQDSYNQQVAELNQISSTLQTRTQQINQQIATYNRCLAN
jgi:uncharacterized protein YkwD/exonuclease VII small subunit